MLSAFEILLQIKKTLKILTKLAGIEVRGRAGHAKFAGFSDRLPEAHVLDP